MGNTTDQDQQAAINAAQNAAKDPEVQAAASHAANKPEVRYAAQSAMKDENIKNAVVTAAVANATKDPNQKQHNTSMFKAFAKNKDVQVAAVAVAKDKQVQQAAWKTAKKSAPVVKSAAIGAFKFGLAAHKASSQQNNNNSGGNKY
mmetsp:Transcript_13165/g.20874  ORF Transcript_13165/g.20874 Transcript_13165/m.20874 type:complete len:146 (-) Transcript_13165:852-1289(-)|eukprot:CAMPEP_0197075692 /NCGR_PEP_ID=MMETSP1384-20130603/211740_1 /TAXON_ID=29189 /ORGANISM="Ammonia sp." /LENGTH=145 /DNA_ID=CAMNT_0042514541 /DNA_START=39 /DNA_END=476 /DNA_ORIENTATION=-